MLTLGSADLYLCHPGMLSRSVKPTVCVSPSVVYRVDHHAAAAAAAVRTICMRACTYVRACWRAFFGPKQHSVFVRENVSCNNYGRCPGRNITHARARIKPKYKIITQKNRWRTRTHAASLITATAGRVRAWSIGAHGTATPFRPCGDALKPVEL